VAGALQVVGLAHQPAGQLVPGLWAPLEVVAVAAMAVAVAGVLAGAMVGVMLSRPPLLRLGLASVSRLDG
jgi:hypothetical protein